MNKFKKLIINLKTKTDDFFINYNKACQSTNENVKRAQKGSFLVVAGLLILFVSIMFN